MTSKTFERFAGTSALIVGVGGLAYSVAFVVALGTSSEAATTATALLLLVGGLLTTPVLVALHQRLRATDEAFALWALLLGLGGALGSAVHGAYNLGALLTDARVTAGLPNAVDPRGFLTFAVTGVSVLVFAALIRRGGGLPRGLGTLGLVAGALLILLFLGRLLIFEARNPALLATAALTGFVINPVWFVWLGVSLRRA